MNFKVLLVTLLVIALLADSSDAWSRRRRRRRTSRRRRSFFRRLGSAIVRVFRPCPVGSNSYPYDRHLAKKMIWYSAIAYHTRTPLTGWRCQACQNVLVKGFKLLERIYFKPLHLVAYVGFDPKLSALVVAFRGTDGPNAKNWFKVNLKIGKRTPTGLFTSAGKVHRGFYNAYMALRSRVWDLVRRGRAMYRTSRVYVTGHSMGGALAVLAALDLKVNRRMDVRMINFGAPRVGSPCFARYYSQRLTNSLRIAHKWDPVTLVPLVLQGYHHVPRYHNDRSSLANHLKYENVVLAKISSRRKRKRRDVTITITDLAPHENHHNKYAHHDIV
ncbi:uncharacterized protein LOC135810344 [Sycon ciliatum]|uniref:uncharacterized protein LOC135810344 n=1 Tax=Sycon ciliatum TaxID=27933 RepID=UPI0031F702CA